MSKEKPGLTEEKVAALVCPAGRPDRKVADVKQASLYLLVSKTGTKTWQMRRCTHGKWRVVKLGMWPGMNCTAARLKCAAAINDVLDNVVDAPPDVRTFGQVAEEWYAERVLRKLKGYKRPLQVRAYLDRDLKKKPIWNRAIVELKRADLIKVVAAKAESPRAATILLSHIRNIFRWAEVHEYIALNPASVLDLSAVNLPDPESRDRALTDDEIRKLWALPAPHGTLYKMLLITGQRTSEVLTLFANPDHIRDGVWYIDDNKSSRKHKVPVTPMMTRLLKQGYVVKQRITAWDWWRRHMPGCDATQHDIRRTCAKRMQELGVEPFVIEALLNHGRKGLETTYQVGVTPLIRPALLKWHAALAKLVA